MNDIVVVHRLVATLLSAMWHLQTPAPPFFPFRCDVALVVLSVVVVGVGDRCRWRPLVTVTMVVVVKQGGGGSEEVVGIVNDGGGGG